MLLMLLYKASHGQQQGGQAGEIPHLAYGAPGHSAIAYSDSRLARRFGGDGWSVMSPTSKEMDTESRLSGRDAHLVKAAPELFDILVEVVECYDFGVMSPDVILRAKATLRKAMGGQ